MSTPVVFTGATYQGGAPFTGFTNPVRCIALAVQRMGGTIDEASFDRMAEKRGDSPPEVLAKGFIVDGIEGIERLCEIANVMVHAKDGICYCTEPGEFVEIEEKP